MSGNPAGKGKPVLKVYAPDIASYAFDESSAVYKTIVSVLIGPIRLVMRVLHNIPLLPPNLLSEFAGGLVLTSCFLGAIGIFDYAVFHRWPLLFSQTLALLYGLYLKRKVGGIELTEAEMREVKIDYELVTDHCNKIYDDLDKILGSAEEDIINE